MISILLILIVLFLIDNWKTYKTELMSNHATFICSLCSKCVPLKNKSATYLVVNGWFPVVGMTRFELATTRPPDAYSTGLSYIPSFFELRCKGTYLWGFCKFSSSFFVLIMSFFLLIFVTCCFVVDYQLLWCWLLFVFVYIQSTLIF